MTVFVQGHAGEVVVTANTIRSDEEVVVFVGTEVPDARVALNGKGRRMVNGGHGDACGAWRGREIVCKPDRGAAGADLGIISSEGLASFSE